MVGVFGAEIFMETVPRENMGVVAGKTIWPMVQSKYW